MDSIDRFILVENFTTFEVEEIEEKKTAISFIEQY